MAFRRRRASNRGFRRTARRTRRVNRGRISRGGIRL